MKRSWYLTANCTYPGCTEFSRYQYDTKKEMLNSFTHKHLKTYTCLRHSKLHHVLTLDQLKVEWVSESSTEKYNRKYFGNSGLITSTGYYADANDFPIGTKIKITCEVILPES